MNPIVGSTRTLTSTWLDSDGAAFDPVVTLRVFRPDGTDFDASPIDNPEVGTFTYELDLTQAGIWYAEWTATTVTSAEVKRCEICVDASVFASV